MKTQGNRIGNQSVVPKFGVRSCDWETLTMIASQLPGTENLNSSATRRIHKEPRLLRQQLRFGALSFLQRFHVPLLLKQPRPPRTRKTRVHNAGDSRPPWLHREQFKGGRNSHPLCACHEYPKLMVSCQAMITIEKKPSKTRGFGRCS